MVESVSDPIYRLGNRLGNKPFTLFNLACLKMVRLSDGNGVPEAPEKIDKVKLRRFESARDLKLKQPLLP